MKATSSAQRRTSTGCARRSTPAPCTPARASRSSFCSAAIPALVAAFRSRCCSHGHRHDASVRRGGRARDDRRPAAPRRADRRPRGALLRRTGRPRGRAGSTRDAAEAADLAVLVDSGGARPAGRQPPSSRRDRRLRRPAIEFEVPAHAACCRTLIDVCKGVEIAVGRRLPPCARHRARKLTRDAALNALKVSAPSALIDNVPVVGRLSRRVRSAAT